MTNLDFVRTTIAALDPSAVLSIDTPSGKLPITAGELDLGLGITVPTIAYIDHPIADLHMRQTPSIIGTLMRTILTGTSVEVTSVKPIVADGHTWLYIYTHDGARGWVASEYLSKTAVASPVIPPSPIPITPKPRAGLHVLIDGIPAAEKFMSVVKVPSVTGVNVSDFLAWAVRQGVPYVIGRSYVGSGDNAAIPSDGPAEAYAYGLALVEQRWPEFANWDPAIYIQLVNEQPWNPGHNAFWLAVMKGLEAHGRKAAIGAFSVGTPEPVQWAQMVEALPYAKANGHIVALHAYGKPGDPPGTLSPVGDRKYYERRFAELYAAVPDTARPPLVISEFAGEFLATFDGVADLIAVVNEYEQEIVGLSYLVGYNLWTVGGNGGWSSTDIESALSALAKWESA